MTPEHTVYVKKAIELLEKQTNKKWVYLDKGQSFKRPRNGMFYGANALAIFDTVQLSTIFTGYCIGTFREVIYFAEEGSEIAKLNNIEVINELSRKVQL